MVDGESIFYGNLAKTDYNTDLLNMFTSIELCNKLDLSRIGSKEAKFMQTRKRFLLQTILSKYILYARPYLLALSWQLCSVYIWYSLMSHIFTFISVLNIFCKKKI